MLYRYSRMHLRGGTPPNLRPRHPREHKKQPQHGYAVQGTTTEHDWPDSIYSTALCTWNNMISCFFYLSYNINSLTIPNFKSTETRQSKEFEVRKHRLRKCEKKIWTRATRLYIVRKTTEQEASDANAHDLFSQTLQWTWQLQLESLVQLWKLQPPLKTCARW